jgi:N-acetylglucosaminyl-diphospho-decaprenol L-rhamnosyltransferase
MLAEIVVVTYRSHERASIELRTFIDRAGENQNIQWTFVDNSEDSADADVLTTLVAGVMNARVVSRPDNPGFAASCNLVGLHVATDWVVFINPDVLLEREAFESIVRALRDANDRVGTIAISQQTGLLRHLGVAFNRAGWFMDRPITTDTPHQLGSREVLYRATGGGGALLGPSGGAAAYRTSLFRQFGGFYQALFAWGEDADLALRLHLAGHQCQPLDLGLPHQGGHSVAEGTVTKLRGYLLGRNRVWVAARLYSWPETAIFTVFLLVVLAVKTPLMLRNGTFVPNLRGIASGYRTFRSVRTTYTGRRLRVLALKRSSP